MKTPLFIVPASSVAKTALIRFSEGLAAETQEHGISVVVIHPVAVRMALVASYFDAPDPERWISALHPAPKAFWSPPDLAGRLCVRLATGAYDRTGCPVDGVD